MSRWLFLLGAIIFEVCGTLALRASVDAPGWIAVVAVGYLAAFSLLGLTLRAGMPVAVAYGVWGAAGVALVALFGTVLFDEHLSFPALVGIGVIIAGVVLVETGTPATPESAASAPTDAPA